MRLLLFIAPFLIIAGCKKESSAKIPLHERSFEWLMDLPTGYANNSGDTLFAGSMTEYSEYISENFVPNQLPEYTQTERYIHSFKIDTFLTYQTVLLAELSSDLIRQDVVIIDLKPEGQFSAEIYGEAEPNYILLAPYRDSIVLNGTVYKNIYSKSNSQQLEMFVNLEEGLVGFALNTDTFNIIN